MIYQIENMTLNSIMDVFDGPVNDVCICRDESAITETYYTVIRIKKHELARDIIGKLNDCKDSSLVTMTSHQSGFLLVFPYRSARPIKNFYMGATYSLEDCERVCVNLIMECMSSKLPYPFLYLILEQEEINMLKDFSVFFTYALDLSKYDAEKGEKDCVVKCSHIVYRLLEPKGSKKVTSYLLLQKKTPRESYVRFTDLYKDVKVATQTEIRKGFRKRAKAFANRNQDKIFKVCIVIFGIAAIVALIMLITQMIFGDIPFLRIFVNVFKNIGTESMLQ